MSPRRRRKALHHVSQLRNTVLSPPAHVNGAKVSDGNEEPRDLLTGAGDVQLSLFQELGGEGTFPVFCNKLYASVLGPIDAQGQTQPSLADRVLWPYFAPFLSRKGDGRAHLERKLTQVLVLATKGEVTDSDFKRLREAHRHLNIPDHVFDQLLYHVKLVLSDLGVKPVVQDKVTDLLESIRPLFVVRTI